jgi:anti-sigma regulatory factor (Ser/Thr protein kinase)
VNAEDGLPAVWNVPPLGSEECDGQSAASGGPVTMQTETAPDVALAMPATTDNVGVARQALTGLCEAAGLSRAATEDVRLAVTEACTNACVHAYDDDAADRPLNIEATLRDGVVLVIVRDRGVGMGVFRESEGLGLGLPLITALATAVEIKSGPDGAGTEVTMSFASNGDLPGR